MTTTVYTQAKAALKKAKRVLIITSPSAQTDAICGAAGLQTLLQKHEITSHALISNEMSNKIDFLKDSLKAKKSLKEQENFIIYLTPKDGVLENLEYNVKDDRVEIILSPKKGFFTKDDFEFQQKQSSYDLIVTLDVDSLEDLGEEFASSPELFTQTPILNLSTSFENQEYGKVNIVEPQRSSVCEILYDLVKNDEVFDKTLATVLLTGIIASTESFLGNKTTPTAFEAASELQEKGADHSDIIEHLFKMKSLRTLKVWGRIMGNCKYDPNYQLAWSSLSSADFEISEATPDDIETITQDILSNIENTEIAALVIEDPKGPKAQIRTSKDQIPVGDFKEAFPNAKVTKTQKGIDLQFERTLFPQAEQEVLTVLEKFQKYRHNIDRDVRLEPMTLEITKPKKEEKDTKAQAKAPSEIPFSAPEKEPTAVPKKKEEPKKSKPKWLE